MKRLVLFGGIFVVMAVFSSCKKEIIQPNNRHEGGCYPHEYEHRGSNSGGAVIPTDPTGTEGGDITDPNDDDYSKRRTTTSKVN